MSESNRKILVTGAAGFIGGSIAETLHLNGLAVRAGIRRWSSAARVARFPIDMTFCDVLNIKQVDRSVKEADKIIHCAVGSEEVTVQGTKNMLESALKHGIDRFVHISTIEVYGDIEGEVDETFPFRYTGNVYSDSKIDAEKLCWEYYELGVPVTVVRPSVVYGPFSKLWTIRFAERLRSGQWGILGEYGEGFCNLVYIKDLVDGIFLAASCESAVGEAFNLNGGDIITWNQYISRLNQIMQLPELKHLEPQKTQIRSRFMEPVRTLAKYLLGKYGDRVMKIYERYDLAKAVMKEVERSIKATPDLAELKLYQRKAIYSIAKSQEKLGFSPKFDLNDGLTMSVDWLNHHGYLSKNSPKQIS